MIGVVCCGLGGLIVQGLPRPSKPWVRVWVCAVLTGAGGIRWESASNNSHSNNSPKPQHPCTPGTQRDCTCKLCRGPPPGCVGAGLRCRVILFGGEGLHMS